MFVIFAESVKERRSEVGVVTSGVTTGRTTVVTTDVMAAGTYTCNYSIAQEL